MRGILHRIDDDLGCHYLWTSRPDWIESTDWTLFEMWVEAWSDSKPISSQDDLDLV